MLERGTGNCDQCPFLSLKSRIARARRDPASCRWWQAHEEAKGFSFGRESFADILSHIERSPVLALDEIEADAADSECGGWCAAKAA